jgi:hypothetical protein
MELTADNVSKVFEGCRYGINDINNLRNAILIHGVVINIAFNPDKVEQQHENINQLLEQLPSKFKQGWSFLNMCYDKDDNQWGEHYNIDQLVCLGLAIERISFLFEREMWGIFPGSVPYLTVLPDPKK